MHKYEIKYSKQVIKFLSKHTQLSNRFFAKVKIMMDNPLDPSLDIKPLQGLDKGSYRLRVGQFRFKFYIIENEIVIYFWDAGGRGDIYK